jgi:hypothetical protein
LSVLELRGQFALLDSFYIDDSEDPLLQEAGVVEDPGIDVLTLGHCIDRVARAMSADGVVVPGRDPGKMQEALV